MGTMPKKHASLSLHDERVGHQAREVGHPDEVRPALDFAYEVLGERHGAARLGVDVSHGEGPVGAAVRAGYHEGQRWHVTEDGRLDLSSDVLRRLPVPELIGAPGHERDGVVVLGEREPLDVGLLVPGLVEVEQEVHAPDSIRCPRRCRAGARWSAGRGRSCKESERVI